MKRFLTILIILLVIIALFVTGGWLIARNRAVKNNTAVPTFKQFLGIGTNKTGTSTDTGDGALTSDFTDGTVPGADSGTGNETGGAGLPPNTSIFTNDTIVANTGTAGTGTIGSGDQIPGTGGSGGSGSAGGSGGSGSGSTGSGGTGSTGGTSGPVCSDSDLTISFTPDEITRLNALQARFYAVAEKLHTDGDIQTETANHDSFKAKTDRIKELAAYCESKVPLLTDANYKIKVATPLWHIAGDTRGFFYGSNATTTSIFSQNVPNGPTQEILEHALRLSWW